MVDGVKRLGKIMKSAKILNLTISFLHFSLQNKNESFVEIDARNPNCVSHSRLQFRRQLFYSKFLTLFRIYFLTLFRVYYFLDLMCRPFCAFMFCAFCAFCLMFCLSFEKKIHNSLNIIVEGL